MIMYGTLINVGYADPKSSTLRMSFERDEKCAAPTTGSEMIGQAGLAIGSILLEKVISKGVDALATYLKQAAESGASPLSSVTQGSYLATVDKAGGIARAFDCVFVARGPVGATPSKLDAQWPQFAPKDSDELALLGILGFSGPPDFLLQLDAESDPTFSSLRLTPAFVYLGQTAAARAGTGKKTVEITFTLTAMVGSGSDTAGIVLRDLPLGSYMPGGQLSYDNPWLVVPPPTEQEIAVVKKIIEEKSEESIDFHPINVNLTYREVDRPDQILSFMSSVLEGASPRIGQAVAAPLGKGGEAKEN